MPCDALWLPPPDRARREHLPAPAPPEASRCTVRQIEPNFRPTSWQEFASSPEVALFEADGHTYSAAAMAVAEDLFYHIMAVLWSPAYRKENEAALRQDWPRVPIPADRGLLAESARLGRAVADLLLPDRPVRGVTCGTIRPELRPLGIPSKVGGGNIDPDTDLKVEATWGFFGAKNAVMCGKGKTLPSAADPNGALDVYINDRVYWAERAAGRVDDDHRRLSGHQEMAQLPRVPRPWPPAAPGRDDLHHRGRTPAEGPAPDGRRPGRELPCGGGKRDGV